MLIFSRSSSDAHMFSRSSLRIKLQQISEKRAIDYITKLDVTFHE
jgi:hypothetical protein